MKWDEKLVVTVWMEVNICTPHIACTEHMHDACSWLYCTISVAGETQLASSSRSRGGGQP